MIRFGPRTLGSVLATALLGCATTTSPVTSSPPAKTTSTDDAAPARTMVEQPQPAQAPTILFFVRHAEKASDGTRDPALLPAGIERANCLPRIGRHLAVTHLFATDLKRTQQTLQPLADAHRLSIEITPASEIDALLAKLQSLAPGSVAVVAGHSNTLPALVSSFGVTLPELDDRGNIPAHEHDRLIEVVTTGAPNPAVLLNLRYCAASDSP